MTTITTSSNYVNINGINYPKNSVFRIYINEINNKCNIIELKSSTTIVYNELYSSFTINDATYGDILSLRNSLETILS
jgi:hypothetical protein